MTKPETWELGVAILTEQGMSEQSARAYLGTLMREWEESDVVTALQASVGKANARAYMKGVLSRRPTKADRQMRLRAEVQTEPPASPEVARAAIGKAREILERNGR